MKQVDIENGLYQRAEEFANHQHKEVKELVEDALIRLLNISRLPLDQEGIWGERRKEV